MRWHSHVMVHTVWSSWTAAQRWRHVRILLVVSGMVAWVISGMVRRMMVHATHRVWRHAGHTAGTHTSWVHAA